MNRSPPSIKKDIGAFYSEEVGRHNCLRLFSKCNKESPTFMRKFPGEQRFILNELLRFLSLYKCYKILSVELAIEPMQRCTTSLHRPKTSA